MTAEEAVRAAGLDVNLLRVLVHPVDPARVSIRPAPGWLKRLWGQGIQAMTVRYTVYVDSGFLDRDKTSLGILVVHELAHARQWSDIGPFGFLWHYLAGYLQGRFRGLGHRDAYMAIDLEVEARSLAREFKNSVA